MKSKYLLFFLFFWFLASYLPAQEWKNREDLPVYFPSPPKTEKLLFYIQRNKNLNTIVYDLRLNNNGSPDVKRPIDAYWQRYGDNGERRELSWLESVLAYGYRSKKQRDGTFQVKLRAYNDRSITLRKDAGQWKAVMQINEKECYLTQIYAYADESGMFPDVLHVDLHGITIKTGEKVTERIFD